jgi:site-specific DNA-cytosine methylase
MGLIYKLTSPSGKSYIGMTLRTMKAYKPIGNAVPPLLGYLIAEKVSDIFNHLKSASTDL